MNQTVAAKPEPQRMGLVLTCEGMGDALFALAVIRKLRRAFPYRFDLFTRHAELFKACPYVDSIRPLDEAAGARLPAPVRARVRDRQAAALEDGYLRLHQRAARPGNALLRREAARVFSAGARPRRALRRGLNTSRTWRTRSWPIESWQRLADMLVARGLKVAVVGRTSPASRTRC
jgi:ADP-heptose:LPS heptosyltransferase